MPAKPESWFLGSGSSKSARACGRFCNGTASSSPAMETSSSALRIPSLDENSRYTVAGGTSDSSLMASIVVCGVAAFEEQDPGGLDDRFAGQAGPRLAALALVGASPLDTGSHARENTTLKLRVLLSTGRPAQRRQPM